MVKILTVCTGNVCRSPFAERYLQAELERLELGAFEITSAGTGALAGHPMDRRAAEWLEHSGGSAEGFTARQLTEMHLVGVDFVFALTEWHRSTVVSMSPRMLKRAFTVREFARVLEAMSAEDTGGLERGARPESVEARWKALPRIAARYRHVARGETPGGNDVVDPYRESSAVYEQMVNELLPSLARIVEFERTMAN